LSSRTLGSVENVEVANIKILALLF
jgi:hypothetical protein